METCFYVIDMVVFTYFSTQCAAVTAQFSLNNAAPHLCKYVDVLHCRNEIYYLKHNFLEIIFIFHVRINLPATAICRMTLFHLLQF